MGSVQVINGNVVVDTRTGAQTIFGKETDENKYYAVAVKCGHCGNGYYIPSILSITAKNKEMALAIARKVGRVKKLNHDGVIAIEEVSLPKYYLIEYINDCDPYFSNHQYANIDDIQARRVVMEGLIVKKRSKLHKSLVLPESVKTADEYDQLHVLQRYLAPRFYGSELVFPRKIDFASALEEYIYENTIELGFNRNKLSILSFYYQAYGPNNELNIDYNNGIITAIDADNKLFEYYLPNSIKEHLDKAKAEFDKLQQEQKQQEEQAKVKKVAIPTARQKFAERYNKYQNMTSANVK